MSFQNVDWDGEGTILADGVASSPQVLPCWNMQRRPRRRLAIHKTYLHGQHSFSTSCRLPVDLALLQIVGGLHLAGPELQNRIEPTIKFLSESLKPSPTYVLPMHCTGFNAKVKLEEALGEGCVPAGVGIKVTVEADPQNEARLYPATIQDKDKKSNLK